MTKLESSLLKQDKCEHLDIDWDDSYYEEDEIALFQEGTCNNCEKIVRKYWEGSKRLFDENGYII